MKLTITAVITATLVLAPAFAKDKKKVGPDDIGTSDPGKGLNFYSLEKEIALGKQMASEVEREARLVNDPVITEYVNRVGQNIVRNSDAKVPFTIKVVDSEDVNAFALPGGFMYVNSGLILKADNEAELAGVMAHEIAHVAARHGTKQASRGELINYATIPLVMMGGMPGYVIAQAASIAVPIGFLKFSRAMESQADHLGVEYMYKSGYDPVEFVDFFERLQSLEKTKPGVISKVFSSHPMTTDRIKAAQSEIQDLQSRPEYVLDTSEFHAVRDRLAMIENRRKGIDNNSQSPTLRHRGSEKTDSDKTDSDGRPTLKRRD